jgi:hypothetical protein
MENDDDQGWSLVSGRNKSSKLFNKQKPDIATARDFNKENISSTTTFFFTNFPERYGAKAIFNAFHNYGEVVEVVIPIKRDKGGRRFGFARFAEVGDTDNLVKELDKVVFGGVKISVNVSRFQRPVEKVGAEGRERRSIKYQPLNDRSRIKSISRAHSPPSRKYGSHSYAQVAQSGHQKVVLSYEVEKSVMGNYLKAFIGVAANPGTTYNIQEAFHSQGYFGVKVTPLGSNLALLEGQEEGEVEALMVDAKDWLDQWFKEIRPWNPNDIDLERIVWLRIFGVPIHAWNDDFFSQVTKPWGAFIKSDNVTCTKLSMDVARLLIRTSCQKPIDEFINVRINGVIFHIRVLEDSYGPMRLMIPQAIGTDGIDQGSNCSEEEEKEEEERRLMEVEEVQAEEIDSEGEGENLLAFNSVVNGNNGPLLNCDQGAVFNIGKEANKDNSNYIPNVINHDNLNSGGGVKELDGGVTKVDRLAGVVGKELGQGDGEGGPTLSINPTQAVKGGVCRKKSKSGDMGRSNKPTLSEGDADRGKEKRKGGVYSNGPSGVYKLLNKSPIPGVSSSQQIGSVTKKGKATCPYIPPSPSLRRQHLMAKSLSNRPSHTISANDSIPVLPALSVLSSSAGGEVESCPPLEDGVTRGPVMFNQPSSTAGSIGSSSILSADIRNCNVRFLKNLEHKVVSKVWKGALDLGVMCNSMGDRGGAELAGDMEEVCLQEIQDNEKRDEAGKLRREHLKSLHQ